MIFNDRRAETAMKIICFQDQLIVIVKNHSIPSNIFNLIGINPHLSFVSTSFQIIFHM